MNTAWYVSLTLSILAALFAIAVQQWLRHLQIPKHIPLREAIRLRQLRHRGIVRYQVPIIISILPALVQISVVLFLIGLLQYVRNVDQQVALPFTVVSSTALVLFVIVSLIPLVDPSCPYKSPIVHIVWQIGWIVAVITTVIFTNIVSSLLTAFSPARWENVSHFANKLDHIPQRYLFKFQPSTSLVARLWTNRELKMASKNQQMKSLLDQQALAWAMTAGPTALQLKRALDDLPMNYRITCVLEWIAARMYGQADVKRLLSEGTLSKGTVGMVNESFAAEYGLLLLDVIETFWNSGGIDDKQFATLRRNDEDVPHAATLLWAIVAFAKWSPPEPGVSQAPNTSDHVAEELPQPKTVADFNVAVFETLTPVYLDWGYPVLEAKRWNRWDVTRRVPSVLLFDLLIRQGQAEKRILRDSNSGTFSHLLTHLALITA